MFITKKHLSRRTFLHGAGVTIALPFLNPWYRHKRLWRKLQRRRHNVSDSFMFRTARS